jgi:hypothetical protein
MIINSIHNIDEIQHKFLSAAPFPHIAIDNFFKESFFKDLPETLNNFYSNRSTDGKIFDTDVEKKWGSTGLDLPKKLIEIQELIQSQEFLSLVEQITGFKNLTLTKDINGRGFSFFHVSEVGSYLGPHTDHTRDRHFGPYHVANIIIYASSEWGPDWGGGTTLFDKDANLKKIVEFKPNRALIFMHSPESIHGSQEVFNTAKTNRNSFYYDFYTDDKEPYKHTKFKNITLHSAPHLFYLNKKIDYLKPKNYKYSIQHLRSRLGYFDYKYLNHSFTKAFRRKFIK